MITKDNFKNLLSVLSFEQADNIFTKHFDDVNASLKVDFDNEELIYPRDKGLKVVNAQTCNFSDPENFVVFECVNRLFEKGINRNTLLLSRSGKSDTVRAVGGRIFWLRITAENLC